MPSPGTGVGEVWFLSINSDVALSGPDAEMAISPVMTLLLVRRVAHLTGLGESPMILGFVPLICGLQLSAERCIVVVLELSGSQEFGATVGRRLFHFSTETAVAQSTSARCR
jgi:hypothetical protein